MIAFLRQLVLLAVAAALSWWLLLGSPAPPRRAPADPPVPAALALRTPAETAPPATRPATEPSDAQPAPPAAPVAPAAEPAPEAPVEALVEAPVEPPVERAPEAAAEPEPREAVVAAAPPPELGAPDGDPDGERPPHAAPEPEPEPPTDVRAAADTVDDDALRTAASEPEPAALMRDPELLATATAELEGAVRRGFATVLLAAPGEQLALARAFGEDVLLVPHRALEGGAPWYRLDLATGAVREHSGRPPLVRHQRYRDLFAYDYARLPAPLRALRRRVPDRAEVALFAAVLPASEWALIVGRRRAALERLGRELDEVERFVLRYVPRAPRSAPGAATDGSGAASYDVVVEEIRFTDGTRRRLQTPASREDP